MKALTILPLVLLSACGSAQQQADVFAPAKLITTHFGSAPQGTPPALTWKPSVADFKRFLDHATVAEPLVTTVDTILHPSEDMALVFFRTTRQYDDNDGMWCSYCDGWLSAVVYTRGAEGWTAGSFNKWFAKQGMYGLGFDQAPMKPVLVGAGRMTHAVRVVSSVGEPEHSRRTDHLFAIPALGEVLSVVTQVHEVEWDDNGIDIASGGEPTEHYYRFIPSEQEWFDVEVLTGQEQWRDGVPSAYFTWSAAEGKYAPANPPGRK